MKVKVETIKTMCDVCGKDAYGYSCLKCGVEHCWECSKKLGKEYKHAVSFSGTGDGYYCLECDKKLSLTRNDPLYNAYQQIQNLRDERETYYKDFERRSKKAEEYLQSLFEAKQ